MTISTEQLKEITKQCQRGKLHLISAVNGDFGICCDDGVVAETFTAVKHVSERDDNQAEAYAKLFLNAPDLIAEVIALRELVVWACDRFIEINPSNYDHDDVCNLNDASVEVVLALQADLNKTPASAHSPAR